MAAHLRYPVRKMPSNQEKFRLGVATDLCACGFDPRRLRACLVLLASRTTVARQAHHLRKIQPRTTYAKSNHSGAAPPSTRKTRHHAARAPHLHGLPSKTRVPTSLQRFFFFAVQSAVTTEEKPPRAFQWAMMVRLRGWSAVPRSSQILLVAASKKMPSLR